MSLKLRDLIRNVRACRSQADERALIAKECAEIRTSFKNKDEEAYRHRNVAKLLYIHMLGYPTHFGQMEAMKLLATQRFAEKRIGYLALIMLFDEHQSLLMLSTNSMKNDLHSNNPYICGLALTAIGNIASQAIARDLSLDVIEVMTNANNNHYLRKKAALTAIRIIHRVPEIVEDFIQPAYDLLSDKHNNVQMCALQLMNEIIKLAPHAAIPRYRPLIPRLYAILRSTWSMSYNVEYDVMGINDPFLQVQILRILRILAQVTFTCKNVPLFESMECDEDGNYDVKPYPGALTISNNTNSHNNEEKIVTLEKLDETLLQKINELLALVIANIDSTKVPGVAIHYEAILTTLTVSNDQNLRVNTIIQLGKFLQSKDNNIRYISLNTMYHVAQQQLLVVANTNNIGKNLQNTPKGAVQQKNKDSMLQLKDLKQSHANALTNLEVIQRYRNIIVAYLKDSDPSIRKMALSLIYALVTEKNVRPLVRELLMYLATPSSASAAMGGKKDDKLQYRTPLSILQTLEPTSASTNNNNNNNNNQPQTPSKKATVDNNTSWTNIPGLVSIHLPYAGGSSEMYRNGGGNGQISSLFASSTNFEFKCDLTQKIYYIVYQYSPNIVWQIYSMICLLSTDNEYITENVYYETITLLQNYSKNANFQDQVKAGKLSFTTTDPMTGTTTKTQLTKQLIDSFIIHELFFNIVNHSHVKNRVKYAHLVQLFLFLLPTNINYLITPQGFAYAQTVSTFLHQDSILNAPKVKQPQNADPQQPQAAPPTPQLYDPTINYNNKQYQTNPVTFEEIALLYTHILSHKHSTEQTKQIGLTSILRVLLFLQKEKNNNKTNSTTIPLAITALEGLLHQYKDDISIDLQQRANEYLLLTSGSVVQQPMATKVALPIVVYNRQNLDFDNDDFATDAAGGAVSPKPQNQQPEVDVFAKLNDPESAVVEEQTQPQQQQQQKTTSLDLLNDLLAPTPTAPVQQQQIQPQQAPTSNPFDLFGANDVPQQQPQQQQQQQQQPNFMDMSNDLFANMSPQVAPAAPVQQQPQQQEQPKQPASLFDDLSADLMSMATPPQQQQEKQQQPTTPQADSLGFDMFAPTPSPPPTTTNNNSQQPQADNNNFDPLGDVFGMSPTASSTPTPPPAIDNTTSNNANNNSDNNKSTGSNFDMLDGMDFGLSATPSAAAPAPAPAAQAPTPTSAAFDMSMDFGLTPTNNTNNNNTTNNNNNDDDDFESAADAAFDDHAEDIIQKTMTVYNEEDIEIVMTYTAERNKPAANNITYKISIHFSTQGLQNLEKFDFKIAMKAPLTKDLRPPSSRVLTFGKDITQELIVVNTATSELNNTSFRCLYAAIDTAQGNKQAGCKPFTVNM